MSSGFAVAAHPAGVTAAIKPTATSATRTITATTPQLREYFFWGVLLAVVAGGAYAIYKQSQKPKRPPPYHPPPHLVLYQQQQHVDVVGE